MHKANAMREIVRRRYSCRTYRPQPLSDADRAALEEFISRGTPVPFGNGPRLALLAAVEGDDAALKRLGTYGVIKNARGFIAGAIREGDMALEDFGYAMESIILFAASRGMGTCWLGGTFTKSAFAERLSLAGDEIVPAVTAVGYPAPKRVVESIIRRSSGADHRKPWDFLFFSRDFSVSLAPEDAGPWREPLEMVRLGPSASNHQPWRVVRRDGAFHLYLRRTKGYRERYKSLIGMADIQRIDMGIAMCHFELGASEAGLSGSWLIDDPGIAPLPYLTEYVATWR